MSKFEEGNLFKLVSAFESATLEHQHYEAMLATQPAGETEYTEAGKLKLSNQAWALRCALYAVARYADALLDKVERER